MKTAITFITLGVVSSPMAGKPGIIDVQVVDYGPRGGTIAIGDPVDAFITIKNSGKVPVEKITMRVNLEKDLPVTGMTELFKGDFQERFRIEPGETKTFKKSAVIPEMFMDVPLVGKYRIHMSVMVEDFEFSKIVEELSVQQKK